MKIFEGHNTLATISSFKQFVELPRANNVIHKSSPTPLLTKHANELITLSQLMNLVAGGSVVGLTTENEVYSNTNIRI